MFLTKMINSTLVVYRPKKRARTSVEEGSGLALSLATDQPTTEITKELLESYMKDLNRAAWSFIRVGKRVMCNQMHLGGKQGSFYGIVRAINKEKGYCLVEVYPFKIVKDTKECKVIEPDFKNVAKKPTFMREVEPCMLRVCDTIKAFNRIKMAK